MEGNRANLNCPASETSPEAELAAGLRAGDTAAGAEFFLTYFDRLYSLVFYSVGKDHKIAEDIAQDAFLSALKSIRKFTGKSNLYAWLVGIANRKIADYYRRPENKRRQRAMAFTGTSDNNRNNPDIEFEEALQNLPIHYRQVLLLKYIEEMPVLKISRVMNRSPKSIGGLLTRARAALKKYSF